MKWFYLSMKVCGCLCSLFFAGFLTVGHVFYELWIPNQDVDFLYWLTVIAVIPSISGGIIRPMFYAYTLTVKRKIPFFYALAGALLNVASMIVLLRYTDLGLFAVVGTTAFYMVLDHLVANALYVCHVLGEKVSLFYSNVARCLLAAAAMTGVLLFVSMLGKPSGWIMLALASVLYSVIGIAVYSIVVFNKDERGRIASMIKARTGRN